MNLVAEERPGLTDPEVLREAVEREAIVVTADKGFGELVFLQHHEVPGVLLLRLAGLSLPAKARLVIDAVNAHGSEMVGRFSVLTASSVRIRGREGSAS